MGITDLDLPVLDNVRGINPLPQVPTLVRFIGMMLVRTIKAVGGQRSSPETLPMKLKCFSEQKIIEEKSLDREI